MTRVRLEDMATLKRHGYEVKHSSAGWELLDPEGANLMIEDYGCVAPTKWEAVAEGLRRIAADAVRPDPPQRAPMRVGGYTLTEEHFGQGLSSYVKLAVQKDGDDRETVVRVALPLENSLAVRGQVYLPEKVMHDPDKVEALALALDRAATILREAREERTADA